MADAKTIGNAAWVDTSRRSKGWTALRWLYALWFISGSIVTPLHALTGHPHIPPVNPTARAFFETLLASGFLVPIITLDYLIGGLALTRRQSTPLGLVLLGPPTVVICGFHFWLSHFYAVAILFGAGFAAMVWNERSTLKLLWNRPT
jgi:hypothetical protein